jgi:hypothetical protein
MSLATRRLLEFCGLMMVGDGALALLKPRGHVALWYEGPRPWRRMLAPLRASPDLTRAFAVAEIGLGLWLAAAQQRPSLPGRSLPRR